MGSLKYSTAVPKYGNGIVKLNEEGRYIVCETLMRGSITNKCNLEPRLEGVKQDELQSRDFI